MGQVKQNLIQDRTYDFALSIVNLSIHTLQHQREYVLSRQVLRSGTSVGANVEEAIGGSSKKDFINKLAIAFKEARETHYWLRLIRGAKLVKPEMINPMIQEAFEIINILAAIIKTSKENEAVSY